METSKTSRSEATKNTKDIGDILTKILDKVWQPWVGILAIGALCIYFVVLFQKLN